jgi:sugar-specific transcriptional regulator TrmB
MNEENILKQAGLSEEQAVTYEALLDKGPQKASFLANWTGINRSLTYKVLEQLENMGLVEKKDSKGSVSVFSPAHPSLLLDKIERDKKNLELAKNMIGLGLGSLTSKYNLLSGKPSIRFFEGEDGIKAITDDLPRKEKEIKQIIDISQALASFKEATLGYIDKRVKLGVNKKMLVPDTKENREYVKKGSPMTEFRFLPKSFDIPTSLQTYEDKITILTLKEDKKIGIIIEDPDISTAIESIFDTLWS